MPKLILNGKEYANNKPDGYPPIIYSTEEREVGVWTDGKPLYQKTYEVTSVVFGGVTNNNNLVLTPEIEIKNYEGYILRSNNRLDGFIKGYHDSINDIVANQNVSQMTIRKQSASPNNAIIQFSVASALRSDFQKVIITIQYTKTTDTPGSGKYTTYGGLTHHYSTTEQVIGTWIDGKPLYELTLYTAGPSNNFSIDLTDYNIDLITNMHGMYTVNGDQVTLPLSHTTGFADQSFLRYNSDKTLLFAFGSYQTPASNITAILQYTKTTD